MFTVRFPNGQAIQYNSANFASRSAEYTDIYTKKNGTWVAQIPNTCIIEAIPACRVYNAISEENKDRQIAKLMSNIKRLRTKIKVRR